MLNNDPKIGFIQYNKKKHYSDCEVTGFVSFN